MDYLENCPISFQISKSEGKVLEKEREIERERERERASVREMVNLRNEIRFMNSSEKDVFNLSKCSQDDLLGD